MVKVIVIFSSLTALAALATAAVIPPDQEWQIVDTHTAQPDCLKATNRQCDTVDVSQVTNEGTRLAEVFGEHVDHLRSYSERQFIKDTDALAANWKRTADVITGTLPLNPANDFYLRVATADMVHWALHLPLFTVFKQLIKDKKKVQISNKVIHKQVQKIFTNSDILADVAFEYLPLEPPIIREQINNLRQWLTDEFVVVLEAFPVKN